MKKLFFVIIISVFIGCGGGSSGTTTPAETSKKFDGVLEKGAFKRGAEITAYEWDPVSGQSGKSYRTNTIDDKGGYVIESSELQGLLDIYCTGFYLNENTNTIESAQLTLSGLADSSAEGGNINIVTHIVKKRVIFLMQNQGKDFNTANNQAVTEFYSSLNWSPENPLDTNISTSAKLLFLSAAICKNRTVSEVSALLSTMVQDMEDGNVDISILDTSFSLVNVSEVTSNMNSIYNTCPNISVIKDQVLAYRQIEDTTIRQITVIPVTDAEFYIFTNGKSLYGFVNKEIKSLNIQYVQKYLGVTETLSTSINEFFSITIDDIKTLYFSVTFPHDNSVKYYSQIGGVITEISALPNKPSVQSLLFNDGEFKAEYNAGPTNVTCIATGTESQGGLLYGYYKSDSFKYNGNEMGRGIFLVWSTSNVSWLSSVVAWPNDGCVVTNITGIGRMW